MNAANLHLAHRTGDQPDVRPINSRRTKFKLIKVYVLERFQLGEESRDRGLTAL